MLLRREGDKMLARGDVVEVRSAAEILATLDSQASTDRMPFMPEMLKYAGKRFRVSHRVEKICDTVKTEGMPASRRMRDTVFLEDLRCDGSAHGGCQAGCRIYWRESWLRRVDSETEPSDDSEPGDTPLMELATSATRVGGPGDIPEGDHVHVYRCQATEAVRASEPLGPYDVRQYVREIAHGNVTVRRFLRVAVRALTLKTRRLLRLGGWQPFGHARRPAGEDAPLDLELGEMVEVLAAEEIAETLDGSGKTRGLWFDWEMIPYCGQQFRVKDRVENIIDEQTGRMIHIESDCLILEGVTCSGDHTSGHWFCPRAIYPYWRESWVRRVGQPEEIPEEALRDLPPRS
jgi:hypothetical protein